MTDAITPDSPETMCELVRDAVANATPLEIGGGFTRRGLGRPVQAATQVSASAISGVSLYEPGALTLVAKAGTRLREIEATLAEANQRLPFEPMDHRVHPRRVGSRSHGRASKRSSIARRYAP